MTSFNQCLSSCHLEDITSTDCDLTWTNKQEPSSRVWSILDRVLVNPGWISSLPNSFAHFSESGLSDHSPVIVYISDDRKIKKRFSFLNGWINHPDYISTVAEAWKTDKKGSPIFCFFEKLKSVKHALSLLHKSDFTSISARVKEAKKSMTDCQANLAKDPFFAELIYEEKAKIQEYSKLKAAELSILAQRAKIKHIQEDDNSTKYFFC
ncbi:uncharacterized protein LOC141630049 [Silene latifolia]|uniref:uncharacterized protein LOC141630049 n=1 Tax=Silene latifolia TaxID=37657 RepID=UPI003D784556